MSAAIRVHTWPTPNGHKVHSLLEELGLPYQLVPVNVGAGEQFSTDFLAITPNLCTPAIEDPDGGSMTDKGCENMFGATQFQPR